MKVVIDRIENQIAVVLFGDEEIKVDLPLSLLPEVVKEGSHLNVTFELNPKVKQVSGKEWPVYWNAYHAKGIKHLNYNPISSYSAMAMGS